MNAFFCSMLAETTEPAAQADPTRLILEYVVYAAIIVVGIFILLLLRSKTRLPRHNELRKKLADLCSELASLRKTVEDGTLPRLKLTKAISGLIYRTDKLIYLTDRMAEKERDGEIASISTLLGQARNELTACRAGARAEQETDGAQAAQQRADEALALMDRVIARDARLKAESTKK